MEVELGGERVGAGRDRGVQGDRVVAGQRLVRSVSGGGGGVVGALPGLLRRAGDHVRLHVVPGGVERGPVAGDPAVVRGQPQVIAVGLRGGLVAVVRGLDDQRLDRVVRDALGAEVPVARVHDRVVEVEEPGVVRGLRARREGLGDRRRAGVVPRRRGGEGALAAAVRRGGPRGDRDVLRHAPVGCGEGEGGAGGDRQVRVPRRWPAPPTRSRCPTAGPTGPRRRSRCRPAGWRCWAG